jgi:hypothetical protein
MNKIRLYGEISLRGSTRYVGRKNKAGEKEQYGVQQVVDCVMS